MNKFKRTFAATAMIAGLGLLAVGCGSSSNAPSGTADNSKNAGSSAQTEKVYNVGSDASYAPFEYVNDKKQVVGFDVDVMNAIAKAEGFKVKYNNTAWDGIFLTLDQNTNDMLISAITITDQRKQKMDFSDPYFEATQMIAYKKGTNLTTLNALKGHTVAVQNGTTGDDIVSKAFGKANSDIKRFDAMPLALQELANGGVDAAVGDNGVVVNYVKNNGAGKFDTAVDPNFPKENYGIAVKKGNTALLNKINDGIKKIKSDGELDKIYEKWFGKKK
ncbi:basic amino acid ABC transporter substrate-binding protein [Fodinisporobacter ferrooxydans]|uniref:Basic amino acid ABC transporter substrate-binding protein n=1 Tax=Fodinisporobacter ferrooxydans TaxID=2901836 RepID=A0ABY4CN02_9BACL|nr:basic amino acid ABC transporter substrate-binding protein [Alicyclobacillaceae bacterium MYW30-H2]